MVVHDVCAPAERSVAFVRVSVPRNGGQPVFPQAVYTARVPDTEQPGSTVTVVAATDTDSVSRGWFCGRFFFGGALFHFFCWFICVLGHLVFIYFPGRRKCQGCECL